MLEKIINDVKRFVTGAILLGSMAVGGCSSAPRKPAPELDNVSEVASYIEGNVLGIDTSDNKDHNEKLIYILPDVHCTTYHHNHKIMANRLQELMGLEVVGIEGSIDGEVTPEDVKKQAKAWSEQEKLGIKHQFARNESLLTGEKPKSIHNLDDYLEVAPAFNLAYPEDGISLVGLENSNTEIRLKKIKDLREIYKAYFKVSKESYKMESIITSNNPSDEILKKIKNRKAKAKDLLKRMRIPMDRVKKEIGLSLPNYDEGIKYGTRVYSSPVFKILNNEYKKCQMDERSKDSINIILKEMDKRNLNQGAIIYGAGHLEQIKEALDKKGVSYIVIKYKEE